MFKKSNLCHTLLFIIWSAALPFQSALGYTVPETAAEIENKITVENGVTKIDYQFPRILDHKITVSVPECAEMLNAYLKDWYFPLFDTVSFNYNGKKYPTLVIEAINYTETMVIFRCVLVNNPLAVNLMQPSEIPEI